MGAISTRVMLQADLIFRFRLRRQHGSYLPRAGPGANRLRGRGSLWSRPVIFTDQQPRPSPPIIKAFSTTHLHERQLQERLRWLVSADLSILVIIALLLPVPLWARFRGRKSRRAAPAVVTLRDGLIAVTGQQLSLSAAFHVPERLITGFVTPFEAPGYFQRRRRLQRHPLAASWTADCHAAKRNM